MNIAPNDKVVCVDDKPRKLGTVLGLRCGQVYCVRSVVQSPVTGRWGVHVVGITADIVPFWNIERAFYADRFRKVEDVGHPAVADVREVITA